MARILALPMVGAFGRGGAVCPPAYLPLITTMRVGLGSGLGLVLG